MQKHSPLENSRLYCPIQTYKNELFFSLVEYRNSRFTSENPDKIIEFYDSFKNSEDLIEWMKERPKGVANIYEVEGDKEIIVVIPTADFNGKYAKECRESTFKGFHMIFVESGGKGDFYFNFAHNVNTGVKKALEYNPKWIVYSNDDMKAKSSPEVLKEELSGFENLNKDAIFVNNRYISPVVYIASSTFRTKFLHFYNKRKNPYYINGLAILNKFGIRYLFKAGKARLFVRRETKFLNPGSFCCYSRNYCESVKGQLYDESIINSTEDLKLGILLTAKRKNYAFFKKFSITNVGGRTLGYGIDRWLRDLSGHIALDYQLRHFLKLIELRE